MCEMSDQQTRLIGSTITMEFLILYIFFDYVKIAIDLCKGQTQVRRHIAKDIFNKSLNKLTHKITMMNAPFL